MAVECHHVACVWEGAYEEDRFFNLTVYTKSRFSRDLAHMCEREIEKKLINLFLFVKNLLYYGG